MYDYQRQSANHTEGRSTGSNGVVAYAIVNGTNVAGVPNFDPDRDTPSHLAIAVLETDRVGLAVVGIPGGTQDIVAFRPGGQSIRFELHKRKLAEEVLLSLGEEAPAEAEGADLDRFVVEKLLDHGFTVNLETPFVAALRETGEEHGLILDGRDSYIGPPEEFHVGIVAKRSIEDAEIARGTALFSLVNVANLEALEGIVQSVESSVKLSEQVLFAVQVPSFEDVTVERRDHKESGKIKGRMGMPYHEKGGFMTAAEVRIQLQEALPEEKHQFELGNQLARMDVVATYGRLRTLERIEAYLVNRLNAEGIDVVSTAPAETVDLKPDRVLEELRGSASRTFELDAHVSGVAMDII